MRSVGVIPSWGALSCAGPSGALLPQGAPSASWEPDATVGPCPLPLRHSCDHAHKRAPDDIPALAMRPHRCRPHARERPAKALHGGDKSWHTRPLADNVFRTSTNEQEQGGQRWQATRRADCPAQETPPIRRLTCPFPAPGSWTQDWPSALRRNHARVRPHKSFATRARYTLSPDAQPDPTLANPRVRLL